MDKLNLISKCTMFERFKRKKYVKLIKIVYNIKTHPKYDKILRGSILVIWCQAT